MVRKIIIAVAALVVLLVAAAFVIPSLVPAGVYREQIQTRASAALGRSVEIAGPVKVSAFPSLQARASDVTIANAEGFTGGPLAQAKELRAGVELFPLLSRRVEIRELVLVEPQISLEVDSKGRNNWTFASPSSAAATGQTSASGGLVRKPGALPFEAALGDVRLVDGSASYVDRSKGVQHAVSDIDLTVKMPSLSKPLGVEGGFALDGDPVRLEARLDSIRSFFDGQASPFSAELRSRALEVDVDGQFDAGEAVAFTGDVRMASDDLRALASKAGASLPEGDIYRKFEISGRASGSASRVAFESARLAFDDIAGTGGLVADLSGARPKLTGDLALGALDVTPYLPEGGGPGGPASGAGGGQKQGGIAPWSEEEIDFGPLRALDADLGLSVESLKAQAFEFGRSDVRAQLQNGRLQVDLKELQAYQGTGTAQLVVDASKATPRLSLDADLANLQAQPFLQAAAGFGRLTGVGGGRLQITSEGDSPAAIMHALGGTGGFAFKDGAIQGVNIAAALRGLDALRQGQIDLEAFGARASTDFTDLVGNFTIEKGVAHLSDFQLNSPLARVTGTGSLDIANQAVDLHLEPRAVASLQGQGGQTDLSGIGIPLHVQGSWGAVSAGVDQAAVQRLLAERAKGALVDKAGEALGKGTAGDLLRGALGLGQSGQQPQGDQSQDQGQQPSADQGKEPEKPEDAAKELLKGLLGNKK